MSNIGNHLLPSNNRSLLVQKKKSTNTPGHYLRKYGEGEGGQSGREKRCDESFQAQAEKPLGTNSHQTISKRSSKCWLLIGHKKCFVLLCPIGEQFLLSSFREFVHDGYCLDHGLSGSCTKEMHAVRKLSVWYKLSISKYCLPENYRCFSKNTSLSLQQVFTLASIMPS